MILKSLLPFEDYVLLTNLSAAEVLKRLADNIEPKQGFSLRSFFRTYTKPYSGYISGQNFTINRNITYRNSFLPIITGTVSLSQNQTEISIKMRPDTSVIIFISIWLIVVGSFCIATLAGSFGNFKDLTQLNLRSPTVIPFIMFIFGYLLTYVGFKAESTISKKFLSKLLEGIKS